jgi:dTDP-4-dehydrorhamnose reductase
MDSAVWENRGVTMTAEDVLKKFVPYSERIMITGCHGLLGQKLHHLLKSTNEIIGVNIAKDTHLSGPQYQYISLDITKASEVIDAIVETRPRFIVNTAAMTGVDLCEREKDKCWRTNVLAVENLVRGARKAESHLIQLSSDYVFNGKQAPYKEEDLPSPLGFYLYSGTPG